MCEGGWTLIGNFSVLLPGAVCVEVCRRRCGQAEVIKGGGTGQTAVPQWLPGRDTGLAHYTSHLQPADP